MQSPDRRSFLKLIGAPALAAAVPLDLSRLLAIQAHHRTGTIDDVEHIVFLMQENRSFDHYFGTMRGVRGFADPRAVKLPSGQSVWHQPNGSDVLLPFRPTVNDLGMTFLPDPPHGWADTHAAWNGGRYDRWVPNKDVTTMTYHTRKDLPFQFALADAFTVCDNYHCSLMGPTDPNRYHMWTGWVGNDGDGGGPVITNAEAGYDWSTYPERLERAGIAWKVYQDVGVGLDAAGFWGWTDDAYIGNSGDNSLLYFHQYQFAPAGTPLADRARTGTHILELPNQAPVPPAHGSAARPGTRRASGTRAALYARCGRRSASGGRLAPRRFSKQRRRGRRLPGPLGQRCRVPENLHGGATQTRDRDLAGRRIGVRPCRVRSQRVSSFVQGCGHSGHADLEVRATYGEDGRELSLQIANRAHQSVRVTVLDAYTSRRRRLSLDPSESGSRSWSLAPMWGWYDLVITVDVDPQFERRLAGHLENGEDSISDPAMGGLV
jgi:hypothetical protein